MPLLAELASEIVRTPCPSEEDLSHYSGRVAAIARSLEPRDLINLILSDLADDPHTEPVALSPEGQVVLIAEYGDPTLLLGKTSTAEAGEEPSTVVSTSLIAPLDDDGISLSVHKPLGASFKDTWQIIDPSRRIQPASVVHLKRGEVKILRPGDVFEYCGNGRLVLKLEFQDFIPLRWYFNRQTGHFKHVTMSKIEDTTAMYLMRLAAKVGDETSAPLVEGFLSHTHYNVRWTALQCLASLDPESAFQALRALLVDSHPEIRRAAELSISANGLS